ncbi:MAG: hypothetical protein A3D31_03520 [Candidatus Fluviicola riflensis]|nr:MAG: hypothetical protein CHH17_11510 [Candidatus Fluviicola riflensis]OGS79047.1 MAG: hypothetical protein A3D31_03520 [Candidatus Fluviicola riflensis]OGS86070.1 MAG: hypothetical protein A3E30_11010 [Fluviicola sp. RIFCSPHIGHO2_12_FULL_43_24]OGS86479.1 MAG: hypothetical protein A2724_02980 [Fluviicola sp. RIFCSPHIGHO2_01_FULL_43_53]
MRIHYPILVSVVLIIASCGESTEKTTPEIVIPQKEETPENVVTEQDTPNTKPGMTPAERKEASEDKIIAKVWAIPEVIDLNNSIRKKTKNKRGLSTRISSEPSDDQEYYGVTVAEDNGESYATYYEFHIYPDYSIRFYDVVQDRELTLEEWRKSNK